MRRRWSWRFPGKIDSFKLWYVYKWLVFFRLIPVVHDRSRGVQIELFSFLRWWRVLREPCRVLRVYGVPLLCGEFWFAPVKTVYSVRSWRRGETCFSLYVLCLLRKRRLYWTDYRKNVLYQCIIRFRRKCYYFRAETLRMTVVIMFFIVIFSLFSVSRMILKQFIFISCQEICCNSYMIKFWVSMVF